ncbi:MAG: flagellin [Planctomycetes bacterium]|nr:flagellin [Planctomycetota bacterium]
MTFSISTNGSGGGSWQRTLQELLTRQQRTFAQLASGKRITSAADDAAGQAIARRLEADSRGFAVGERNVADGRDLARIADGAMQSTHDAISRMRELAVQAGNGALSADDRATLQQEFDQLAGQIDQTAHGVSFGGRALLDGSAGGDEAIEITDGAGGSTRLDLPDAGAAALGVAGLDVADPHTLTSLDAAAAQVADARAAMGAAEQTFSRQQEQLAVARVDHEAARSRLEDADLAQATAERARQGMLVQMTLLGLRSGASTDRHRLDLLG